MKGVCPICGIVFKYNEGENIVKCPLCRNKINLKEVIKLKDEVSINQANKS